MSESASPSPWQRPETVAKFLQNVRGAVPLAIEQIDIMLRLIGSASEQVETFLNLGCGDAVLATALADEFPGARGLLLDCSEAMMSSARGRLEPYKDRLTLRRADYHDPAWVRTAAPLAPYDAIVSGFAAHQVPDPRKRELYREVFSLLRPGGIFLNLEHVASATRWTESVWDDYMIDAIFGEHLKRADGKTRAEVAREYYEQADQNAQLAPLEVQCDWLREIGFENVDCYLKVFELAVFGGQRGAMTNAEP